MTTIEHALQHVQANLDDCILNTANQIRQAEHQLTTLQNTMQTLHDEYAQLGKIKSQSVQQTVFYEVRSITSRSARILHYLDYAGAKRQYDQCLDDMQVEACATNNTVEHTTSSSNRLVHMARSNMPDDNQWVGLFELCFH